MRSKAMTKSKRIDDTNTSKSIEPMTKDMYKDILSFMVQWLPSEKLKPNPKEYSYSGYDQKFSLGEKALRNDSVIEEFNKFVEFRLKIKEILGSL